MLEFDLRILLIGDFAPNQNWMRNALLQMVEQHLRLEGALSGAEGLARYQEQQPDVILLDLNLPDMNPITLLNVVQGEQERVPTPVILIADATHDKLQAALAAGAFGFLGAGEMNGEKLWSLLQGAIEHTRLLQQQGDGHMAFDDMANAVPVMIWISGTDKGCTFVNVRWLEFTGRTFKQELGFGWMENIHPDDLQRCRTLYGKAFDAREPLEMAYRLRRHDGVYRWILDQALPRFANDGAFLGYMGSSIDITEQKQTETKLRFLSDASRLLAASRDVKKSLQEIAELAVPQIADWCITFRVANDGTVQGQTVQFANPEKRALAQRLAELPLEEGHPVVTFIRSGKPRLIPDVSQRHLRRFAQSDEHLDVLLDMDICSFMFVPMLARGDVVGAIAFGISESARQFDEKDLHFAIDLAHSAGIAFDSAQLYAEQMRAEAALRENVDQSRRQLSELQAIYATAPAGLCFVDAQRRFVSINETLARMNGCSIAEHIGRTFADVLPSPAAHDLERICKRVAENGHPARNVEIDVSTDPLQGERRYWLGSFYPIWGGDEIILGINIVVQDISERKRTELNERFLAGLDARLRQLAEPEAIAADVVSQLGHYANLVFCSFSDVELGAERITIQHDWRRDAQSVAGTYAISSYLAAPFLEQARAGETIVVHDTASDPRTEKIYAEERIPLGVRAFLLVPYLRDGEWVALLIVADDKRRAWRQDEVALVEAVATRVWQALQRARAEQARRDAAEQRRMALDSAQMGAWGIDYKSGAFYCDERSCAIFGMTPDDEVTFDDLMKYVHPADQVRMKHAINAALDSARSGRYQQEFRVLWPDDTLRWGTIRGQAYFEGEGEAREAVRFTGTVMDVTERKEAEEALRESEERFRSTFEQAAVGISHVALDGTWLRVNQRLCDIVGYSKEELLQKTFQDITYPDDLQEDLEQMQHALDGEMKSYVMEKRYVHKSGRLVWVQLTATLIRDPETREPLYFVTVTEDISVRKEAENALRQSEERFQVALKNSPIVVYNTDRDLRYTWIYNPLQGLNVEDYIGKRDDELLPPEHVAELIQFKQDVLARGVGMRREISVTAGAQLSVFDVTAEPLFDNDGEIIGLTVAAMDITGRKRTEKELQALNETLEQRVKERTRQVRKLASELTLAEQRERRRIARVLHDDIQQMLYSLQISTLVMEQDLEPDVPPGIEEQMRRMQALIDRIIDANRKLTVELSPPVLKADGLDEAFEWLLMHFEEYYDLRIELLVEGDCDVPDDDLRELIFQLVRELLLNVVRHAGVRQAKVSLFKENGYLITKVEDKGIGFEVADVMTPQNGFGLYSVQERLDLFGGKLQIESRPGDGTTILIAVPLFSSDLSLLD